MIMVVIFIKLYYSQFSDLSQWLYEINIDFDTEK